MIYPPPPSLSYSFYIPIPEKNYYLVRGSLKF